MRSVVANIYYLYLIKLSKWLMLIMPIVVLFYNENHLDTYQIYLLHAAYSISVACFEIPSGYMADVIGRKTTLIAGSLLGTVGFVVLAASDSFGGFFIAELILGLGGSFISGSDSALLYDSLAAEHKQHYYLRYEGRITALGNFAETVAAIGGGLLAAWLGYRAVYCAQTVVAAIAIPASLLLVEPAREKLLNRPSLGQISRISRQALFQDPRLASLILAASMAGTATLSMAWTAQIYFVEVGFTEKEITPLWVALNLSVAVVSAVAATVVARLGVKLALVIMMVWLPLSFVLLGALDLTGALIVLFMFYLIRGYGTPLLRNLINHNCDSSIRATVLSIRSLLIRLFFSIGGPAIGYLAGSTTLATALIAFGLVLCAGSALSALFLFHQHDFKEESAQQ